MYGKGMRSLQRRAGTLLRRTAACGFLQWARRPCTHGVAATAKLPTAVGDTVTGPQDQGKLHEDRAAEDVSRTPAVFAAPGPELQPWGATIYGSVSALVDHANCTVCDQQQSPY